MPNRTKKLKKQEKPPSSGSGPKILWAVVFGVWLVFLSGLFSNSNRTPGIAQAIRLNGLLSEKRDELLKLEKNITQLEEQRKKLKENPIVQEREARRVLGYVGSDEIVFDFSTN